MTVLPMRRHRPCIECGDPVADSGDPVPCCDRCRNAGGRMLSLLFVGVFAALVAVLLVIGAQR